jgi:hypothetical protein
MKKGRNKRTVQPKADEDTMRPEYDFSKAVRGVTAARYARGTNVVVLDPDVVRMFPNANTVNEALRALGGIIRRAPRSRGRRRPAAAST